MKTVNIDAPEVTNDEAIELCIYHLRMAQTYFEASDDGNTDFIKSEYDRMVKRSYPAGALPVGHKAAMIWIDAIDQEHEDLKQEMGG